MLAVAGHGDEILMTRPCYFNHESALGMLGVGIGYVDCHALNGMLPEIANRAAIVANTRAITDRLAEQPCDRSIS